MCGKELGMDAVFCSLTARLIVIGPEAAAVAKFCKDLENAEDAEKLLR